MCKKSLLMMLLLALLVPWAANAQTSLWSEDFEDGTMPEGWTTDGSGTWTVGTGDYSSTTGAGNGTYNAKITHGTTGNVTKLITPEIDLSSVSSAELSFMHVQRSWAGDIDELRVYYRTSSSGSWNQLVAYTTAFASWTTESGIVLPDLSSTYQLAFEHTDNYGYGVGVDNIVIVQGASCLKPTGLTASYNGDGTATASWTSDASLFNIDVNGTVTEGVANPYTFNVDYNTTYSVKVQADCGSEQSGWTNSFSFTTPCAAIALPYFYDFEDPNDLNCWDVVATSTSTGIAAASDAPVGSNVFRFYYTERNAYLASPVFSGTEQGLTVSFQYMNSSTTTSYTEQFQVGYTTEAGTALADFIYGETIYGENQWVTYENTFPANTKRIAIKYIYTNGMYLRLDDFSFEVPSSCPKPTGLAVSNIDGHSATISWTSEASAWVVAYKTADATEFTEMDVTENPYTLTGLAPETAYQVKVQNNCGGGTYSVFTNPVSFTTTVACVAPSGLAATLTSGDGTVATLTWTENGTATEWDIEYGTDAAFEAYTTVNASGTPSKELTGLTPETKYYARVKTYCGGEDGYSTYSNVVSFTPTNAYALTVNDGTNTNGYVPVYGTWVDRYSKSQFIIPAADLADMQWGTINKLTFHASNTSVDWGVAEFEVYMKEVDYTTFEAATLVDWASMEKVMNAGSLAISGNQMVIDLDTPYQYGGGNLLIGILQTTSGTFSGSTWYGVNQEASTAIGGYENSRALGLYSFLPKTTFDYIPGEEPSCMWPTDLAVSNIGARSVELSWTENGEATTWNIGYQIVGEEEQYVEVTENPYTLTGLTPETDYEVRVQSKCSDTEYSVFTSFVSFTTGIACIAPTGLVTSDIFGHGATITWTAEEGAMYQCALAKTAEYDPENINWGEAFEGNTQSLTNLDPETGYTFALRKDCGSEDGYSTAVTITFTTDVACHAPTNVTVSDVEPIAATVNWEGTAANYNLRYRHAIDVDPSTPATIILEAHDVWQDGSGYQMLLDADATAFGVLWNANHYIFVDGEQYSSGDLPTEYYDEFEYKIPTEADGSLSTTNIVMDGSVTITIPAGTYDYVILNPTPGDRFYIAADNGEVPCAGDDYVFEPGVTYHFTMQMFGSGDGAALEIIPTMSDWTVVENATNPYALTNLIPETYYEVQVQAVCGGEDGESLWVSANFTTPSACDAPNGLEATNVEATTATLGWTGYQDSYNVRYRTAGFDGYYINETFDGEIGNWTVSNLQSGSGFISGQGVDGSNCFGFKYTTNPPQYLISPVLAAGAGGKTLTFSYRAYNTYYAESFKVGFATGEETSFEEMTWEEEVTTPSGDVEWHEYQTTVPEGTSYFVIQCTSYDAYYLFVDNFVIYDENAIEEAGEWVDAVATTNSLDITGLTPETMYEFQVQGINPSCTETEGLTEWSEIQSFTTLEQPTTVTQTVELTEGFNWFSLYVDGNPIEMLAALQAALDEHGVSIEGPEGINYNLGDGLWWGDLDDVGINNQVMYLIEVDADCTIEFEGMPCDPSTTGINIEPGYNWIAYPCAVEMEVEAALEGFEAGDYDAIEGPDGVNYYLGDGFWWGDFEKFVPGQGYVYYYTGESATTLYFQTGAKKARSAKLIPVMQDSPKLIPVMQDSKCKYKVVK